MQQHSARSNSIHAGRKAKQTTKDRVAIERCSSRKEERAELHVIVVSCLLSVDISDYTFSYKFCILTRVFFVILENTGISRGHLGVFRRCLPFFHVHVSLSFSDLDFRSQHNVSGMICKERHRQRRVEGTKAAVARLDSGDDGNCENRAN